MSLTEAERAPAVAIVRRAVARAADREAVLRPGESILLACSGGADSTAMLDACLRLAPPRGWRLTVASIDHGLREGAAHDADTVEELCARNAIRFVRRRVRIEKGSGIQARAREARYATLKEVALEAGAGIIATAHTADDQAETVLMHAFSQATPAALAGIVVRGDRLARPMLRLWRDQTRAYCHELRLPFVDDPANSDPRYTRSRVRHELIPTIESVFPAARRRLVALAEGQVDQSSRLPEDPRG